MSSTQNKIYSESHYNELKKIYNDENDSDYVKSIINKCFKCIYGISFEEFECTSFIEYEKKIEQKNKEISDLKSVIDELRTNYIDLHQRMNELRKKNIIYS